MIETLDEYITREHGGSQAECAREFKVSRSQIGRWMKEDVLIIGAKLYLMRKNLDDLS